MTRRTRQSWASDMLAGTHIDSSPENGGVRSHGNLIQRKGKREAACTFCLLDSFPERRDVVQLQESLLHRKCKGEAACVFCLLAKPCTYETGQFGRGCERETSATDGERASYYEALDMLYQRTTFAARRTHAIRALPRTLPAASWHRVRALHLSTAFEYPATATTTTIRSQLRPPLDDFTQWGQTCRVLASLNLSSLDLTLALWPPNPSRRDTPITIESLALLLDPLRSVRAGTFVVTVTSNVPPDAERKLSELPFELRVRDRSGLGYFTVESDD